MCEGGSPLTMAKVKKKAKNKLLVRQVYPLGSVEPLNCRTV